jgi:tetratricopeptide (TPR) repeat protein
LSLLIPSIVLPAGLVPAAGLRRPMTRFALLATAALLAVASAACQGRAQPAIDSSADGGLEFVGRQSCRECHPDQDRLWKGSHHDLAMQEALDRTVLGDFDDTQFTHAGVTSTFCRRDGGFFVRTDGSTGEMQEFQVRYTFGAVPLQQYLVELPGGRLQALTVCWDTRPERQGGQRWFHLYPEEEIGPGDPLHWTGPFQNWNYMCAECHSTNLKKNYDAATGSYSTSWSEIDVSCEACHGPGSEHVEWGRAVVLELEPPKVEHMGLAVRLTDPGRGTWIIDQETDKGMRLAPAVETAEIETCARCHSRRTTLTDDYEFGRPLGDTHRLALLDEELYHADGQILEEVYVHGSYLQSRMHAAGVTCSDCHEAHSSDLLFPGDSVCARCHTAAKFDTAEHHFHQPGTEGSHCVDCHMPPKNYMVVDPRHDHSLRIPRPDLSLGLGTPNACNDCHDDKTARWAADKVAAWYGPKRRPEPHYGEAISAARNRQPEAGEKLLAVLADAEVPAIARATAVGLVRGYLTPQRLGAVEIALSDEDPLLRRAALTVLEAVDVGTRLRLGSPLLDDPVLTVRMQAAQVLASVPDAELQFGQRSLLRSALNDYETAQRFNADRAEGRLNLGWLAIQRHRLPEAEREYRAALEMAPWFAPAYVNLADLYRLMERESEAEEVLRQGLESAAETADIHHALGLALARAQRQEEALEHLEQATRLAPDAPRYAYVYGVALNSAGRTGEALEVLQRAHQASPVDRELLFALATISRDAGAGTAALVYARKLAELAPYDPGARQLVAALHLTVARQGAKP